VKIHILAQISSLYFLQHRFYVSYKIWK
jgi:hypothetical protein